MRKQVLIPCMHILIVMDNNEIMDEIIMHSHQFLGGVSGFLHPNSWAVKLLHL